jgi:hypothetical protein
VAINNESEVNLADVYAVAQGVLDRKEEASYRQALADLLDAFRPGWKADEGYVAKIKEVGVEAALTGTLTRVAEKLA